MVLARSRLDEESALIPPMKHTSDTTARNDKYVVNRIMDKSLASCRQIHVYDGS